MLVVVGCLGLGSRLSWHSRLFRLTGRFALTMSGLYLPGMPVITILELGVDGSKHLALPAQEINRPAPVICESNQTIDVIPAHCLSAVCHDIVF